MISIGRPHNDPLSMHEPVSSVLKHWLFSWGNSQVAEEQQKLLMNSQVAEKLLKLLRHFWSCWRTRDVAGELPKLLRNSWSCWGNPEVAEELVKLLRNSRSYWETTEVAEALLKLLKNSWSCWGTPEVAEEIPKLLRNSGVCQNRKFVLKTRHTTSACCLFTAWICQGSKSQIKTPVLH